MKGGLGDLLPSRAFSRRMHELETELQQARTQLRRFSKSPDTMGRWRLEQPDAPQQEEGWFITYLDMMTLLLVVMIVMLAFSGSIGERASAFLETGPKALTAASSAAKPEATGTATPAKSAPAAEKRAASAPEVASHAEPESQTLEETSQPVQTPESASPSSTPGDPGLLPGGSGLLPGLGTGLGSAVSQASSGAQPGAVPADGPAHPADIGPLPRDATIMAGRGNAEVPALPGPRTEPLYPGWSAADLAASFIGPPKPGTLPASGIESPAAAPSTGQAAEDDAPSEGELLAADLPLGELGADVEIVISERTVNFRVNSEILFDSSQADLSRSGLAVLRKIVSVLVSKGYDITVEGHTDSVPVRRNVRYPSNWELSSARAGSVVRYLQANGIDRSRLKAVGYADTRPIADNNTPDGRARNRRVELVIEKHH